MNNKVLSLAKTDISAAQFQKALEVGRPDNIKAAFPDSKALIVSGKLVNELVVNIRKSGIPMGLIAVNGRNEAVIKGALKAAQKNNSALIVEIAKSEGGIKSSYCPYNYLTITTKVNQLMNSMGITVPVVMHADHYGIKTQEDIETAKVEIPQMVAAGMTSIAIDASHMPHHKNAIANIIISQFIPGWMGYETETGEIIGKKGLSSKEDAMFLIGALNAHGVFPNWIALNNGTTHGLEASGKGIQVGTTKEIHNSIAKYGISGAQHGTSGNDYARLRDILSQTNSTKLNVATALQMISWGIKVNEFGNAVTDADNNLVKVKNFCLPDSLWNNIMLTYAKGKGWSGGNLKKLNKEFEEIMTWLPHKYQQERVAAVERQVSEYMQDVFRSTNSASAIIKGILENGSADIQRSVSIVESADRWGVNLSGTEKEAHLAQVAEEIGVTKTEKTGATE